MKVYQRIGLIAAVVCGMAAFNARAIILTGGGTDLSDPFVLNFNENGNGQISINGAPFVSDPGSMTLDPTWSGQYSLTYTLPSLVVAGDVRIWDPGTGNTVLSDVLRFTDANGDLTGEVANLMIFYSDIGGGSLADTGFPATLVPNDMGGIDENADGSFQWAPGGTGNNIYNGLSRNDSA